MPKLYSFAEMSVIIIRLKAALSWVNCTATVKAYRKVIKKQENIIKKPVI